MYSQQTQTAGLLAVSPTLLRCGGLGLCTIQQLPAPQRSGTCQNRGSQCRQIIHDGKIWKDLWKDMESIQTAFCRLKLHICISVNIKMGSDTAPTVERSDKRPSSSFKNQAGVRYSCGVDLGRISLEHSEKETAICKETKVLCLRLTVGRPASPNSLD